MITLISLYREHQIHSKASECHIPDNGVRTFMCYLYRHICHTVLTILVNVEVTDFSYKVLKTITSLSFFENHEYLYVGKVSIRKPRSFPAKISHKS